MNGGLREGHWKAARAEGGMGVGRKDSPWKTERGGEGPGSVEGPAWT